MFGYKLFYPIYPYISETLVNVQVPRIFAVKAYSLLDKGLFVQAVPLVSAGRCNAPGRLCVALLAVAMKEGKAAKALADKLAGGHFKAEIEYIVPRRRDLVGKLQKEGCLS